MLLQIVALVSAVALYYILPEAYIHTGIKEYTTKSTTKQIVPEMKWVELKTSNSILPRSSHGVSIVHLEGKNMLVVYGGENVARTPLDSKINVLNIDENRRTRLVKQNHLQERTYQNHVLRMRRLPSGRKCTYLRPTPLVDEAPLNDLYFRSSHKNMGKYICAFFWLVPSRSFHKMVSVGKTYVLVGVELVVEWLICIVTTLRQRVGRHCRLVISKYLPGWSWFYVIFRRKVSVCSEFCW